MTSDFLKSELASLIDANDGKGVVKLLQRQPKQQRHQHRRQRQQDKESQLVLGATDDVWGRGKSILARAIALDRCKVLQSLVKQDPSLANAGPVGYTATALEYACQQKNFKGVRILLDAGAVPTQEALILAAQTDVTANVRALLKAGADPNTILTKKTTQKDVSIHCPLLIAAVQWGHLDVARKLLMAKAHVDARIHSSHQSQHQEDKDEYENEYEYDENDMIGYTALHVATRAGSPDFMRLLCQYQANVNADTDREGWTPLHLAVMYNENFIPTTSFLLDTVSADPMARDKNGMTAMHLFWREGRHLQQDGGRSIMEYLLARGVPLDQPDHKGKTPLLWACQQANPALVQHFVALGANLQALDHQGRTALHYACLGWEPGRRVGVGPLPFCQALLALGANPVTVDHEGNLPFFHLAVAHAAAETTVVYDTIFTLFQAALHHGLFQKTRLQHGPLSNKSQQR